MSLITNFASKIFPEIIWTIDSNEALLTIDDSPSEKGTNELLNFLNTYNTKALFFIVGSHAEKFPELVESIHKEGHLIGNHGYFHKSLLFESGNYIENEIGKTNRIIEMITGYSPKYFRPPFGRFRFFDLNELDKLNMRLFMWSLLIYDYKNSNKTTKLNSNKIKNGSILVMHDNYKTEENIVNNFNILFQAADEKGVQFGDPKKCLK